MSTRARKTGLTLAAAIVAALGLGAGPALAHNGTGIWVYNCHFTITVVNMTDQKLSYSGSVPAKGYEENSGVSLLNIMYSSKDDTATQPWTTRSWGCCAHHELSPTWFDGTVTVVVKSNFAFNIVAKSQGADGADAGSGTWFSIAPLNGTFSSGGQWYLDRWATPTADLQMHNVMTLIGPEVMVSMSTADNVNIVIVVQEYGGEPEFTANDPKQYFGYKLDFVDNSGGSVP